jgi:hypothetical protein
MSKVYRASITFDIYPEENELVAMHEEEDGPMTEEQLINFARSELNEVIYNGLKYEEIWDMIDVEVIDE